MTRERKPAPPGGSTSAEAEQVRRDDGDEVREDGTQRHPEQAVGTAPLTQGADDSAGRVLPVYPLCAGLSQAQMRKII